jgi:hypothetical protein
VFFSNPHRSIAVEPARRTAAGPSLFMQATHPTILNLLLSAGGTLHCMLFYIFLTGCTYCITAEITYSLHKRSRDFRSLLGC